MSTVELVSAFERDGIDIVGIGRRPRRPTVGRRPFPVLDVRTRDETAFEKANGVAPLPAQIEWLEQRFAKDMPLKPDPIFRAGPVTVFRGSVWHGGMPVLGSVHARHAEELAEWGGKVGSLTGSGKLPRLDGVSAIVSAPGARNYFHWLIEVSPRLFALAEHVREGGRVDRVLLPYGEPAAYVRETVALFHPELADRILYYDRPMFELEECLFFTDQARYDDYLGYSSRWKPTTAFFSERIDDMLGRRPRGPGRSILVSRRDAPTRRLVDEDLLLEAFAHRGLERVELGGHSVAEQMAIMADAEFVIGVHGAGMTNLLFCRPGTVAVEITSTQYIRRCRSFADIAMHRDLPYGLVVVDQTGDALVIRNNRGNDLELAPKRAGDVVALVDRLSSDAPPAGRRAAS